MTLQGFKKYLVLVWNKFIDIKNDTFTKLIIAFDNVRKRILRAPEIKSIDDTIDEVLHLRASVSRYGDGEFKLMMHRDITFQRADELLARRLKEILLSKEPNFFVCLPDVFQDLSQYEEETRNYWKLHISKFRNKWYNLIKFDKVYYNSFISRCYYPFRDKTLCGPRFENLKRIWHDREIVLVEGRKSRLGVGNDLFNGVKSIERILVPEENAFAEYDRILLEVSKTGKEKLLLLAIGPTATVLAYDLYKKGYQAIDIGHVDIEYEWFLKQAPKKLRIENKYVCEAGAGDGVGDIQDVKYLREIIVCI